MRNALRLLLPLIALLALSAPAIATDLGKGNEAVGKTFDAYVKGGHRTKPSKAKRRVMITGFGLFSGVSYNISGVVVESMANPKFWPATTKLAALGPPPPAKHVGSGKVAAKDGGARVWQRTLTIDGETYEVCFLVVDVLWDLGAAITLWEAQQFKPHLIVMTGRGGRQAVFEHGALNRAAAAPGFRPDGSRDPENKPTTVNVLDPKRTGVEREIGMPWDNQRLAAAARPIVDGMAKGYKVVAATAARPNNTYICNNISCVVLHGLKGSKLALAGGRIRLETKGLAKTTAGFFHYPRASTNAPAEVQAWARMLATVVKTHFASPAKVKKSAPAKTRDAAKGS